MNHRVLSATVFALGALAIVALLLGPGAITSSSRPSAIPILPRSITFVTIGILSLAFLCALGMLIYRLFSNRKATDPDVAARRRFLLRLILSVVVSFFLFYVISAFIISLLPLPDESETRGLPSFEVESDIEEEREEMSDDRPIVSENETPADSTNRSRIIAIVALIAGSVASIAVAIVGLRRFRKAPRALRGDESGFDDELLPTAHRMLERLRGSGDDRDAVIAAYGMVETTFANHGFKRDLSVTPRAFVERVVSTFWDRKESSYQSLVELSLLFELAKFSDHRIKKSDRRRAIGLMERLIVYLESRRVGEG